MAHLDKVRSSVGADDNASGIAAVLEVARQLRGREHRVVVAIVDLEELWCLAARELARTLPWPGLVVCLDAVGFFDDRPLSRRLPAGFGVLFPRPARQLRAAGLAAMGWVRLRSEAPTLEQREGLANGIGPGVPVRWVLVDGGWGEVDERLRCVLGQALIGG